MGEENEIKRERERERERERRGGEGEARESSTTCKTCSHDHTTVVEVVTPKSISVQFLTDEKKIRQYKAS